MHAAPLALASPGAAPGFPAFADGPSAPPAVRLVAPVIGRLVQCGADGVRVEFADNPLSEPVAARTTIALDPMSVGAEVVLFFEDGDPARPIVMGVVRQAVAAPGVSAELDGERVQLTAEREIVLRCGEASITLTRAGKVLIRGTYILTRSSGANRIKGAAVEIN